MEKLTDKIAMEMCRYFGRDIVRVNHSLKVFSFCAIIAKQENLTERVQEIVKAAGLLHDIGIKPSEEKYHSAAGTYQQVEGPPVAREILAGLGCGEDFIERVCFLIAHHHTYHFCEDMDYQILIEADFLVNIFEENVDEKASAVKQKYFKTRAGTELLETLYLK